MFKKLHIRILERLAFNAFALSKFEVALKHFLSIQHLDPNRKGIFLNQALTLVSMKRFSEALIKFQQEEKIQGKSLTLCKGMAEASYRMGNREVARKYYKRAVSLKPTGKEKAFLEKRIAICSDEALFNATIEAQALMDKGDRLMQQKEFDKAEHLFKNVYNLDATSFQALNNLGAISTSKKDYSAAKSYFLKADELVDLPMIKKNLLYLKNSPDKWNTKGTN